MHIFLLLQPKFKNRTNTMHYLSRLEEAIRKNWDRPALGNYRGETFTYGEFATHIAKFHMFFEAIGLKKGDKVALCAKNSARWGITFFTANTYEAVLVPILADFHPDSVNSLVDHSESIVLLTDTDIWNKLDITKMPTIKAVLSSTDFFTMKGIAFFPRQQRQKTGKKTL